VAFLKIFSADVNVHELTDTEIVQACASTARIRACVISSLLMAVSGYTGNSPGSGSARQGTGGMKTINTTGNKAGINGMMLASPEIGFENPPYNRLKQDNSGLFKKGDKIHETV